MNPTIKRYLISSATTFIATFLIVGGMAVQNAALAGETLSVATLAGLIDIAIRAAVKAVVEGYLGSADPVAKR